MEVPSPSSLRAFESSNGGEGEDDEGRDLHTVESIVNPTVHIPQSNADVELRSNPCQTSGFIDNGGRTMKKNKRVSTDASGSSSSARQRGFRVTSKHRNSRAFIGGGGRRNRNESDLDAVAILLGISFATVVGQVLDRKNTADDRIPADHLSMIWTSAVEESLANVFGNKFDCFVGNFEKSFGTTLRTIRSINEASLSKEGDPLSHSSIESFGSNDLKTFEIGLIMKRLQLKEAQLALNYDSNHLERFKLSMGISKASFKAEKFKNKLEDTKHTELLKKCMDCLVAGLLIMSASLVYGAYVFSYKRIREATALCMSKKPVSYFTFTSERECEVEVVSKLLLGLVMILGIAYLLLQRSAASKQTMPVTFILLLLGVACGFVGKLCVDMLGGSGYHWLLYWEALCLLHFFANIFTSTLFSILHGPVYVSQGAEANKWLPYWIRRFVFYAIMLLFLPLVCGLTPFAGPGDWKDHFSSLAADVLFGSNIGKRV